MYYFVYHVNTIGLYWEEKSSFLKYEIIGFTIRKKSRIYSVSAIRLKMKKMRWTITETDNGRSFLFTKFSVIDFFLTDKRNIFMYTAEIGLRQILQLSIFVLSHEKYHYPGQGPNFRFIFFVFVLLPLLGNFEVKNTHFCFFFLAAIIRENLDMRPWIENGHRFAIHLLTWHSWLVISNTCKKLS